MKLLKRIIKKILRSFKRQKSVEELRLEKQKQDFDFLTACGVETELGFVELYGKPVISKYPGSRIVLGKGVVLVSDSAYNTAGINHPVILSTLAEGAILEVQSGVGMSGTSVVCVEKISIGENTMLGANTNIYETDFHAIDPQVRKNQKNIMEAAHAPVVIDENVWVGANTTILKGVCIGKEAVVGAHSLVTKNIGEREIHAGVPARFVKEI